ncbi:Metallocarboxypeptidase A-like protein 1 [Elsinoe fawcettii]|nr:Metallocarboxypeptidase A-like protein 1 [Elsinoe fawcettii]
MKAAIWSSLAALATASVLPREAPVDYAGFKAFRVAGDAKAIHEATRQFHLSQISSAEEVDVVVSPAKLAAFKALGLNSTVVDEDLGASIAEETSSEYVSIAALPSTTWWDTYHPYADHLTFLRDLQGAYPANSEIVTAGSSAQGRVITGIHIWGNGGKGSKPNVLFHGNVHAREWITSMNVEYFAYQLLTGYNNNAEVTTAVNKFDYWIFPIVNPDGFLYSQTTDRLWRKNRQTLSGSSCVGRDNNRNWPFQWSVPGGSSTDPCSETYRGQAAGDSPEIRGLVANVQALKAGRGIRLYIDFHSYGQYILTPVGYSCSATVSNQAAQNSLAAGAGSAIRAVSGTAYTTGPSCSTLYATSGSSTDYVGFTGSATYTFTYELRDTGRTGFVLPAAQIRPTAVETWAGVRYMLARV